MRVQLDPVRPARVEKPCRGRPRRAPRRGIAMVVALVLVALVGIVTLAMTTLLAADARRTQDAQRRAQLHELLRIAAADAQHRLTAEQPIGQEVVIELPPALGDEGLSLRYSIKREAGTATASIAATNGNATLRQTVTFANENDRWQVRQAALQ